MGSAYTACPSSLIDNRGISNRITTGTSNAATFSAHAFHAPLGTRIAAIRWGGRFARNNCSWGTLLQAFPSRGVVFGLRPHDSCTVSGLDVRNQTLAFGVPAGTTAVQQMIVCGAASCQPGATFHTYASVITIDDPTAPSVAASGAMIAGNWVRGDPIVTITGRDNTGIARAWITLGGRTFPASWVCRYTSPRPCSDRTGPLRVHTSGLASGQHPLVVSVQDAAGNVSSASYPTRIDNDPPARVAPVVSGGQQWRRSNRFTVTWRNPPQSHAPIARAWYRLCGPQGCWTGALSGNAESLEGIVLGGSGEHALQIWLEDEAGNQSYALTASDPVHLRLDQEAPELTFQAPVESDPLRVAVRVEDRLSGLDAGEIEIRERGGTAWHSLATAREGQLLVAYVDDERFRSGSYEFRARARDRAGNEGSTDRVAGGARATIDLPARFTTRLSVGYRQVVGRGRKRRVRITPRTTARHATRVKLFGRLTNADGQPLEGAAVLVSSDSPGDAVGLVPVGQASTDRNGRFTYVVSATRNKVLRFRYSGSRRIRAATEDFALSVPARSTIRGRPRRLRNGQFVRLTGTVLTRPLPPAGKLIEVQAHFRGRFRTFSTTRADADGQWRFTYRFGGTRGRVPYRLRVRLPAEGGYPFITGRSPVARVVVIGP